jgi:hypothetical protein
MRRKLSLGSCLAWLAPGVWVAGCSLEADLPSRTGSAAPANTAVTVSGAGARDDADAAVGYGEGARITDIHSDPGNARAANDRGGGGTDSGGISNESADHTGGATSPRSGAAGAGGKGASSANAASSGDGGDAGSGGATIENTEPPVLWFSEYIEGSSSNKALEITTRARANLDGCKVSTYFNGKTEATIVASLSGTLEAGQVLTLCTSSLKDKLPDACNQVGNLTFNGDDTLALSCEARVLDVIGQIGVDPGVAWGSEMNSTADHTLRRHCTVQSGDALGADEFDPGLEWQALPIDTFDGLGTRGC